MVYGNHSYKQTHTDSLEKVFIYYRIYNECSTKKSHEMVNASTLVENGV